MALLLSLLVLPLMAMLAFTLTKMGISNLHASRSRVDSRSSAYVSEAATEYGLQLLKTNPGFRKGNTTPFTTGQLATVGASNVVIYNNKDGDLGTAYKAPNGADVPPGYAYVLSTTRMDDVTRAAGMLVKVQGELRPWGNNGISAPGPIKLSGNSIVNLYTSANGKYGATRRGKEALAEQTAPGLQPITNPAEGVVIATGSVVDDPANAGELDFNGSKVRVGGRVEMLRGATQVGQTSAYYVGAVQGLETPVDFPPVVIPSYTPTSGIPSNAVAGNYYTGTMNSVVTLTTSGKYVFDKIDGSKIKVPAGVQVEIFVTGKPDGSAGDLSGLNVWEDPASTSPTKIEPVVPVRNVTVNFGPDITQYKMTGNGSYVGAMLYAPHTDLEFNSAKLEIFGSVAGKTVDMKGNSILHYDKTGEVPMVPPSAVATYRQRF